MFWELLLEHPNCACTYADSHKDKDHKEHQLMLRSYA